MKWGMRGNGMKNKNGKNKKKGKKWVGRERN
jgi:hypothetical protein